MMERPCDSSLRAWAKTARAPSPDMTAIREDRVRMGRIIREVFGWRGAGQGKSSGVLGDRDVGQRTRRSAADFARRQQANIHNPTLFLAQRVQGFAQAAWGAASFSATYVGPELAQKGADVNCNTSVQEAK